MLAPVIAEIAEAASELLPVEIVELGVKEGGITQHEAVLGVLAVGAVHAGDPGNDEILDYSDQRPTRIYFPTEETRKMPDVIAETCVPVTGAGGSPVLSSAPPQPHHMSQESQRCWPTPRRHRI